MNAVTAGPNGDLANKIARLVEERGWNQEDFARIANLNRHSPIANSLIGSLQSAIANGLVHKNK